MMTINCLSSGFRTNTHHALFTPKLAVQWELQAHCANRPPPLPLPYSTLHVGVVPLKHNFHRTASLVPNKVHTLRHKSSALHLKRKRKQKCPLRITFFCVPRHCFLPVKKNFMKVAGKEAFHISHHGFRNAARNLRDGARSYFRQSLTLEHTNSQTKVIQAA